MKNLLIIIIALLPAYFAAGQTKAKKKHKGYKYPAIGRSLPDNKKYYDDCKFINKYTVAQRRKFYPFSKAAKIIGISYDPPSNKPDTTVGSKEKVNIYELIRVGKLRYQMIMERVELNPLQVDSLTSILYNYNVKVPNNYQNPGYSCFNPRNTLFFVDKEGMVFDYLHICFECENTRSFSDKILTGNFCNQKYEILRQYFIAFGFVTGPGRANRN